MVPRPNTNLARSCTTCTCSTKFLSEHTRLAQVIESVSGSFLSRNGEKGRGKEEGRGEGGAAQMNQVRPSGAKIVPQIVGNIAYITRHAKHSYGPLCLVCVWRNLLIR